MTYSKLNNLRITRTPVADLGVWRQRQSWHAAAAHLNAAGFAACVPCPLVATLRRRGLDVWCQERAA